MTDAAGNAVAPGVATVRMATLMPQAAETPAAAPEAGGGGLSRSGLAAIIVAALIVGLSLLAAAALVVRWRQVRALVWTSRVGRQQRTAS